MCSEELTLPRGLAFVLSYSGEVISWPWNVLPHGSVFVCLSTLAQAL